MNGGRQTDQTREVVPRLVLLLFSLAVVAEWAATMPAPVRYPVLIILRRAEAIAWSHIYWEAHGHGLSTQWILPDECRQYCDPQAAMMLGWWFRVLAVALRDLPRRAFVQKTRNSGNRDTATLCGEVAQQARVGAEGRLPAIRAGPIRAALLRAHPHRSVL
jgi:hypothetical protein